jgi:hypothetical protein
MYNEFQPLVERFAILEGDDKKKCFAHNRVMFLDVAKSGLANLHDNVMLTYTSGDDSQKHLSILYESVVTTRPSKESNALCGELVHDAMATFHQVATDPKTERMTALYALGYACQLVRDPNLLQMDDPSPYIDMLMDVVNDCDATGRRDLRKKAQRMRNGLVYDERLAPYLTGFFVLNSGIMCASSDDDPTEDDIRIAAFLHWAEVTHDVTGRDTLIDKIRCDYDEHCREIAGFSGDKNVPSYMIAQQAVYKSILQPFASAA